MSDRSRISYVLRHGVTLEDEAELLAAVYSFVLECGEARRVEEEKKGGAATALGDDAKEIDGSSKTTIPK